MVVLEQVTVIDAENRSARGCVAAALASEFPSIFVSFDEGRDPSSPHLRASEWASTTFDFWRFDCAVDDLARGGFTLCLADDRADGAAFPLQVLTRCQRTVERRNRHSQSQQFDRVLRAHRRLHDLDKPLVRADYNHALDTWQWTLRLDADAPLALQFAALLHDVERLTTEADVRVEQHAADYQQFKDAHARAGANIARQILRDAGVCDDIADRAAELIATHETTSNPLNDADALSFFSLNSSGYVDYFGAAQAEKKVGWTWKRMSDGARARVKTLRLREDVHCMLDDLVVRYPLSVARGVSSDNGQRTTDNAAERP